MKQQTDVGVMVVFLALANGKEALQPARSSLTKYKPWSIRCSHRYLGPHCNERLLLPR